MRILPLLLAWSLACSGTMGTPPRGELPSPSPAPSSPPLRLGHHPPNLLLVIGDDVGVDKVGVYGVQSKGPSTPTIDGLAATGLLFRNAWSYPMCSPTRSTLMTGRHARRTGVGQLINSWADEHELAESEVTMPEVLSGYDSSLTGKWHLGSGRTDPKTHAMRQGFDWVAGSMGNLRDNDVGGGKKNLQYDYFHWQKNVNGRLEESRTYATTDTVDDAIDRMGAMKEPWLLVVSFNAGHYPVHVPPAKLHHSKGVTEKSSEADQFDATLEAMDTELGRLLGAMNGDQRDHTVVVFLGDNGTPDFGVRPPLDPDRAKGTLFQGGVHVPLIVSGPGVTHGTTDALAHTVDILPTFADLAGARITTQIDGVSLVPVLSDPSKKVRDFVYAEIFKPNGGPPFDHDARTVFDGRYKLVVDARDGTPTERLYDLKDRVEEGPNLLGGRRGRLTPAQTEALEGLRAEDARLQRDLVFGR
ncbi:MAG: sulfatase-like hydrolase/transferase [Myxococcales bacterium]|nr:sulfatase-like hydrolase/transferase [Myxococcales bacterium]